MLQLIAHIIIVTFFCFIWGIPALIFQNKNNPSENFWSRSGLGKYIFLFFSGLITLSIITAWAGLMFPLNFSFLIIVTAGLLICLIFFKKQEVKGILKNVNFKSSFTLIELSFITVCLLLFIVLGCIETVNSDTNIYHIQIILWTNEYGTVPGIANLFPRFGLGSNWFNLVSSFRIPAFKTENYTYLNSSLVIWFFLWLFNNWRWHLRNFNKHAANKILSLFYLLLILFCLFDWELFRDAANSTSYDFIVTGLTIMIISWMIESILSKENSKPSSILFIILCISVIPFKLSGIFVFLLLLFYLLTNNKLKLWFHAFSFSMIIVVPLLIKNYFITGYPLYPLNWSLSSPDWQVPIAMTDYLRHYIYITNRFYNFYDIDYTTIPELLNKPWLSSWFNGILLQHKFIFIASYSSLSLFFLKGYDSFPLKKLKILFFLLFLMAAGWFFTAPSPRFGYGVLLILAFSPICFFAGKIFTPLLHKIIILLLIVISGFYAFKKLSPIIENKQHLLYPVVLERSAYKTITIKGTDFYLPELTNNSWMRKCNNIQLPCISQENKYLEPRGKNLKDGFRMNQQPDSTFIRNYIY